MFKLPLYVKVFILIGVLSAIFSLSIYGTVQHVVRMSANNPQVEIAEDVTSALNNGAQPSDITGSSTQSDMANSLAAFVIIYDTNGNSAGATAQLDNAVPKLPSGVLDNVKNHGEERITWQPKPGVRIAAVVTSYKNGFVLAGVNLREVEKTERDTLIIAAAGLVLAWILGFILCFLLFRPNTISWPKLKKSDKSESKDEKKEEVAKVEEKKDDPVAPTTPTV